MFNKTKITLAITTALLSQLGVTNLAYAADDQKVEETGGIERIEVRTRKMTETIEKIPLAITALSNREVQEKGIQSTEDVAKFVNGLTFDIGGGPNDTRPSIRGLTIDRGRPNVAILVDGIDVSSETMTLAGGGMTANMKLLDLQQVEVVKGPQSVNYGRSAFAGAVNYVTKLPGFETSTKVDLDVGQHGILDFSLSSETGFSEELAARVKVIKSSSDGQYTNPNSGEKLGSSDVTGFALSTLYLPSDDLTVYFRAETSDEKYGATAKAAIRSILSEFDPMSNPFATGTVNTEQGGKMLPFSFDGSGNGVDCSAAEIAPYYFSFDADFNPSNGKQPMGPDCLAMVVGEIKATEADIDLSLDPLTGKDFTGTEIKNSRAALEITWENDSLQFVSSTSVTKSESSIKEDFDATDYELYSDPLGMPQFFVPPWSQYGMQGLSNSRYDLTQLNQEFRLSGEGNDYNWVTSVLLWKEEMETLFGDQFTLREGAHEPTLIAMFAASPYTSFITDIKNVPYSDAENKFTPITRDTSHWSVAGLFNYSITADMNITVEGRFINETIDYTGNADDRTYDAFMLDNSQIYDPSIPPYGAMVPNPNYETANSVSNEAFLPRVSLDYQVNETVFTYASISKGFKPGGITTTDANGDVRDGEYKPEQLIAYEAGAKAFSPENNVLVNIATFYWLYTDQQTPYTFFNSTGLATVSVINAGETEVKGLELDSIWQITPELRLSGAYLYSDARYLDFNLTDILPQGEVSNVDRMLSGNSEGDFSGKRIPMSAIHSGTVNARYTTEVAGYHTFAELFGKYSSDRYVDRGENTYLPAYWEWDLTVGISKDEWSVTGYVKNLLDDDSIKSGIGNVDYGFFPDGQALPFSVIAHMPNQRTAGVKLSYTF